MIIITVYPLLSELSEARFWIILFADPIEDNTTRGSIQNRAFDLLMKYWKVTSMLKKEEKILLC